MITWYTQSSALWAC